MSLPPPQANSLARAAMAFAVLGCCVLPFIGSAIGVIAGMLAYQRSRERRFPLRHDGLALPAVGVGLFGFALMSLLTAVLAIHLVAHVFEYLFCGLTFQLPQQCPS